MAGAFGIIVTNSHATANSPKSTRRRDRYKRHIRQSRPVCACRVGTAWSVRDDPTDVRDSRKVNMSRWCILTWLLLAAVAPATAWGQSQPYFAAGGETPPNQGVTQAGYFRGGYATRALPPGYGALPNGPIPSGPGRTIYEQLPDDQGWLYDDAPIDRVLKSAFRHAYFRVDYLLWDVSDPGQNFLGSESNLTFDLATSIGTVTVPAKDRPVIPAIDVFGNQILAAQPTLTNIFTNENNGVRGTFGLPLAELGVIETSVFGLATSRGTYVPPDLRVIDLDGDGMTSVATGEVGILPFDVNGDGLIGVDEVISQNLIQGTAQAVMVDGVVPQGDNFLLLGGIDTNIVDIDADGVLDVGDGILDNPAYIAAIKTSTWGAESNFFFAPRSPNQDLTFSPMFGVRYMNFREELRQSGGYELLRLDANTGVPVDPVEVIVNGQTVLVPVTDEYIRRIDATSNNNLYGPQIGLRSELRRKWFAVGATPKVMLGLNSYRTELGTSQILGPNDPSQSLINKETTFGVVADLEVFSRIYLGEHVSIFAGYNFLWAGLLARPADQIIYNVQSATAVTPTQSAFDLKKEHSGAIIQGLSVGGQIEY
ncbi:MAG: hypothetical protein B7Z55_04780 [Planctomycetales bacterium 12-60-4]|nr:MAG: hypothetical protein B7Z55_04780 [Planctomycetales bacterium 12-60-4]